MLKQDTSLDANIIATPEDCSDPDLLSLTGSGLCQLFLCCSFKQLFKLMLLRKKSLKKPRKGLQGMVGTGPKQAGLFAVICHRVSAQG